MIADDASVDFYAFNDLLTPEERAVRQRVRTFVEERDPSRRSTSAGNGPRSSEANARSWESSASSAGAIPGYGCPGLSVVGAGLTTLELARGDGSINTIMAVQSGLAMPSIYYLGSEEQKVRWLPPLARGEAIGAFGLTEPLNGSDASRLQTQAHREGDYYVLNGQKRWIGNASVADVTVVWARDDDGRLGGFLVEKGTEGFNPTVITGKGAARAVWQTDIVLENCRVPTESRLPKAKSFRDTTEILQRGRPGGILVGNRPRAGLLRNRADLHPRASAVWQTPRGVSARSGQARAHARRDHRDAAALLAGEQALRRGSAHPGHRVPCQA